MIEVKITADTVEEARRDMRRLLNDPAPGLGDVDTDELREQDARNAREAEQRVPASEGGSGPEPDPKPKERPLPPTKKTQEFAAENNVDLATAKVEGTGKNGRITKADVERFVELRDAGMAPSSLDEKAEPELPAGGEQPDAEEPEGETEEPEGETEEAPEPEAKPAPSKPKDGDPTLEEARDKLMELSEHVSLAECREMCRKHGANKVQDIDPIKFRAFMNDCDQKIREAEQS